MTNRYYDPELTAARESLKSLSDKSENLYRSGGNLDRNGEPTLTAARGDRSFTPSGKDHAAEVRKNMRGPDALNMEPQLDKRKKDAHITGQVGGRAVRPQRHITWEQPEPAKKTEEAARRFTKLNIPAARPMRLANDAGVTSFHFSHEAISKTRAEKTTARGTKNRKGAAKDHVGYIERSEALAKGQTSESQKIQAELLEQAKSNADFARQLGINPDAGKIAAQEAAQRVAEDLGAGGKASVYIEREEALAHDPNGVAVLYSNISDDPIERRDFWKLVERAESNPSADKMQLRISANEEFWANVAQDDDCPKVLRDTIEAADPCEIVNVQTGDNIIVRKVMIRHGWKAPERRPAHETDAQRLAREDREAATAYGAKFKDGRGGRVQFRVVGELPYEVSHDARVRILKDFTREFEARDLPFIAVMHAPDHTNDDRNWHFHLVYHDRPAKRFTGLAADHVPELAPNAGSKQSRQHEIRTAAIADPEIQKHVGKWDFTVPWSYQKPNRHIMTTTPFLQPKDRDCNKRDFVPMLRRVISNLTNRELEAAGVERRVDPRRYSEMGIHKETDEHLGTQASLLESNGVPTQIGVRNEQNQWDFIQRRLEAQAKADQARIDRQLVSWRASLRVGNLTDEERGEVDRELIRWEQSERVAAEHRAIVKTMEENLDRLRSRANKVAQMSKRHLSAIDDGRATKRQRNSKGRYQAKLTEAEMHLAGIEVMMGDEISQITKSTEAAKRQSIAAENSRLLIEGHITLCRQIRAGIERTSAPSASHESEGSKAPASNNVQSAATTSGRAPATAATLGNSAIERFFKTITDHNRRLVKTEQGIVPRDQVTSDKQAIAAANYEKLQPRLTRIMERQEEMISNLVIAFRKNPGMIRFRQEPTDSDAMLINVERFKIATPDRNLQAAFLAFADEPEVAAEIAKAEERLLKQRAAKAAPAPEARSTDAKPDQEQPGAVAKPTKSTPAPANCQKAPISAPENAPAAPTPRKPANDHGPLIDMMRTKFLRPRISKKDSGIQLAFHKSDVALFNLPQSVHIEDQRSISRIEGIVRTHDRSIKRLLAYVAKNPAKVEAAKEGGNHQLVASAPSELVEIAQQFSRDPELTRAMQKALVKARLEAADPRKPKPAEKPAERSKSTETTNDNSQDYGLFKIEGGRIVMPTREIPEVELPDQMAHEPSGYSTVKRPKEVDREPKQRERATIKIDPSRVHEFTGPNEATQKRKIKNGIHPLFDEWIEANRAGDRVERARLSQAIRADKRLREMAQTFEPGIVQSFKRDWEDFNPNNKSSVLGQSRVITR